MAVSLRKLLPEREREKRERREREKRERERERIERERENRERRERESGWEHKNEEKGGSRSNVALPQAVSWATLLPETGGS